MASKKFNLYKEDLTANITEYSDVLDTSHAELVALFSIYTGIVPKYAAEILGTLAAHHIGSDDSSTSSSGYDYSNSSNLLDEDHCLAIALHYIPAGDVRKSINVKGEVNTLKKDDYKQLIEGLIDLFGGVKSEATKTLVQEVAEKLGLTDDSADLDNDGKVDADDIKIAKAIVSTVEFEEEAAEESEEAEDTEDAE